MTWTHTDAGNYHSSDGAYRIIKGDRKRHQQWLSVVGDVVLSVSDSVEQAQRRCLRHARVGQ